MAAGEKKKKKKKKTFPTELLQSYTTDTKFSTYENAAL